MSGALPLVLVLTPGDFRAAFKAFKDPNAYPDNVLQMYFDNASNYISTQNVGALNNGSRQLALYQMTAHLLRLNDMICENDDAPAGIVQDAQVDKVRVSLVPPVVKNEWSYWLQLTPYGQALLALLKTKAVGGFYITGSTGGNELGSFRRQGGLFSRNRC